MTPAYKSVGWQRREVPGRAHTTRGWISGYPHGRPAVSALPFARQCGAAMDLMFVVAGGRAGPREPGSMGGPTYIDHAVHAWPYWARDVLARVEAHGAVDSPPMGSVAVPMQG